jgi:hypothetical protein
MTRDNDTLPQRTVFFRPEVEISQLQTCRAARLKRQWAMSRCKKD